jgi:von Willebrand factor type A domain-containing protein
MAERELFDALNDCIDRINAGERLDDCLADYPQLANRLRPLLATGLLVSQAQDFTPESADDQEQMRPAVVEAMRRRARLEAERRRRPRRVFVPLALAASVVLILGFASVMLLATRPSASSAPELTATYVVGFNATQSGDFNLTQTAAALLALSETYMFMEPSVTSPPIVSMTPRATATLPENVAPIPTIDVGGATLVPETPIAFPSLSVADVNLTATALATIFMNSTGVGVTPLGGGPSTEVGIVPTSVALMSPAPSMTPPPTISISEVNPTATDLVGHFLTTTAVANVPTSTPPPTTTVTMMPLVSPTAMLVTPAVYPTLPPTWTPPPQMSIATLPPTQIAATLPPEIQVIPLEAGEIDDNAKWDDYQTYRSNFLQQYGYAVHNVDVSGRQIITVSGADGLPVLGAQVNVYDDQTLVSQSETYANGQTLFFPNATAASRGIRFYRVIVTKDNASADFMLLPEQGPNWNVTLQNAPPLGGIKLDVLFLLDSTGSMEDEINQLQNNILGISSEIAALPGSVDTRYGLVTYRDRGDEYVTRTYDFTPDVGTFQMNLNQVQAGGGGDTPESLNQALHEAVENVSWRGDDTVKLIFLVADAAPHLDYPNDFDYAREMAVAASRGIKIEPIASSGLEPDGEYIFRQMAEYTMGHFIFLTYDQGASGAPGESRPDLHVGEPSNPQTQQQGDYTVQQLDKLVLRLIEDELAALTRRVESSNGVSLTLLLGSVPPPPENTIFEPPTPFPTPRPTDLPPTSPPRFVPETPTQGITWPYLLLVVAAVALLIGYGMRAAQPGPKPVPRKRKNDEQSPTSLMALLKNDWQEDEAE